MLTAFKKFLRLALVPVLYFWLIVASFITIFKKVEVGLFLMIVMIPQPNIWYKLHDYPYGKDFMDILFISIVLGLIIQKKGFAKVDSSKYIIIFLFISYFALWNSSIRFSLPVPLTMSNSLFVEWKNYAEMILIYYFALNCLKDEGQQKVTVVLMSLVILFISIRSYRNFTGGPTFNYEKRVGGPFEAVGLGANHMGAFVADYCGALLGLFLVDKNLKRRLLYGATILFGLHPLLYSYSRGAYLAFFAVLTFYAVVKKRSLLVVVAAIFIAWQTLLPASVVDRIMMTTESDYGAVELESSAAHRLDLWEHAIELFQQSPVFGVGYGAFGFTVSEGELTDTHNFYLKTLSEQGIVGVTFLVAIFLAALRSAWKLIRRARTTFHKALGFGFMGCIISMLVTNMFGDRWSYFVLGAYFWLLWGLVDRSVLLSAQAAEQEQESKKDAKNELKAAEVV